MLVHVPIGPPLLSSFATLVVHHLLPNPLEIQTATHSATVDTIVASALRIFGQPAWNPLTKRDTPPRVILFFRSPFFFQSGMITPIFHLVGHDSCSVPSRNLRSSSLCWSAALSPCARSSRVRAHPVGCRFANAPSVGRELPEDLSYHAGVQKKSFLDPLHHRACSLFQI